MGIASSVAIYLLFWAMTAFVVLPFGVKTHDELGIDKVRGQADSAPGNFSPWKVILRTTALSAALFGLYYLNYVNGWVVPSDLDFFDRPDFSDAGSGS